MNISYIRPVTLVSFVSLLLVIFLPSVFQMTFKTQSMAQGLALSLSIIFIFEVIVFFNYRLKFSSRIIDSAIWVLLLLLLILVQYFFAAIIVGFGDFSRFFGGYILLALFLFSAILSAEFMLGSDETSFKNIIYGIFFLLYVNGLISLTKIDFFNNSGTKPTFAFSEPSIFALVFVPFLMFFCLTFVRYSYVVLLSAIAWALYIQNLTMLIGCFLVFIVLYNFSLKMAIIFIMAIIFASATGLDYFVDRLDFLEGSENLSVLVYLQGWENAFLTLVKTNYYGVGFQQFGISSIKGGYTEIIYNIFGAEYNTLDGGSLASKIIGEFGVVGGIFICFYFFVCGKSYFLIRDFYKYNIYCVPPILFSACVVLSGLIEFFIRGVGYFTPSFYILICSFVLMVRYSRKV